MTRNNPRREHARHPNSQYYDNTYNELNNAYSSPPDRNNSHHTPQQQPRSAYHHVPGPELESRPVPQQPYTPLIPSVAMHAPRWGNQNLPYQPLVDERRHHAAPAHAHSPRPQPILPPSTPSLVNRNIPSTRWQPSPHTLRQHVKYVRAGERANHRDNHVEHGPNENISNRAVYNNSRRQSQHQPADRRGSTAAQESFQLSGTARLDALERRHRLLDQAARRYQEEENTDAPYTRANANMHNASRHAQEHPHSYGDSEVAAMLELYENLRREHAQGQNLAPQGTDASFQHSPNTENIYESLEGQNPAAAATRISTIDRQFRPAIFAITAMKILQSIIDDLIATMKNRCTLAFKSKDAPVTQQGILDGIVGLGELFMGVSEEEIFGLIDERMREEDVLDVWSELQEEFSWGGGDGQREVRDV